MRVIKKDFELRRKYNSNELIYYIYKALKKNGYIDKSIVYSISEQLNEKKSGLVKIQNRCIVTGRKRSTYKKLRRTRMEIKYGMEQRFIQGLKKIVW